MTSTDPGCGREYLARERELDASTRERASQTLRRHGAEDLLPVLGLVEEER